MLDFWLKILGKGEADIPDDARVSFVLQHAPQSWKVFVLVGVVVAILYAVGRLYRTESNSCSRSWKTTLTVIRAAVVLLAVFVFLGPALTYTTKKVIEPYVLVLLDDSMSMSINDRYTDPAKAQQVGQALGREPEEITQKPPTRSVIIDKLLRRNNHELIRKPSRNNRVRVMTFSERVRLRKTWGAEKPGDTLQQLDGETDTVKVGDPIPPLSPEGKTTNIARAIRKAQELSAGSPLAGIIMLSDGQHTAGGDPAAAASRAGKQNCPIFTIGIGDPSEPVNLRVADLAAPENVFTGDPILVKTSLRNKGLQGSSATIKLRVKKAEQQRSGRVIETKRIDLTPGRQSVSFKHTPEQTGSFQYSVSVSTSADELLRSDNTRSAAVNVLEEKVRILLVSGTPSWEYRFVKTLLKREKTIDLSCWLQSMASDMQQAGNTPIQHLPQNREQLMDYDAVLLFDPNPAEFTAKWIKELRYFMENHAGGLLWMSGPQYSISFLTRNRTRGIRDLLPVRLRNLESGIVATIGGTESREWPWQVSPQGVDHPVLQVKKDPQKTADIWESLPGVYWTFPAYGPKPGAQVLMEHSNPQQQTEQGPIPLLVTGQYGPGHSVYIGFQSTWRWRETGLKYFQKFWIQTVRHLVEGRLLRGRTRGRITTGRDSYAVGDRVSIKAELFDASYEPLTRKSVDARVKPPDDPAQACRLRPVPGRKGRYQTSVIARHMGRNNVVIELQKADGTSMQIKHQFSVKMPNVESADPRMNKDLLTEIAQRAGGQYFAVNEISSVVDAVPQRRKITTVHGRPIPLWDTSRVLLLFVILLTIEWALRKRFRLL